MPFDFTEHKPSLTHQVVARARELLSNGWCQGPSAKNAAGDGVSPQDEDACEWCASGAVFRAVFELTGKAPNMATLVPAYDEAVAILDRLAVAEGSRNYINFNERLMPLRQKAEGLDLFAAALREYELVAA